MESVSGASWTWYVKYLAGNDTLLTAAHQAGVYISKGAMFRLIPGLNQPTTDNPRVELHASVDSHGVTADPAAIWYNNRLRGGTRDECRITGWGGSSSPLMDPEATGSLCVFAVQTDADATIADFRVWLCSSLEEEDAVEDRVGPVEPGAGVQHSTAGDTTRPTRRRTVDETCRLRADEIPAEWRLAFPEATKVAALAAERMIAALGQSPDRRLVLRRDCEFAIFRSIEEVVALPRIREGFATVDLFIDFANSVANRRKSRSGASLELQARAIFDEEKLPYSHDEISEERKRPDFLFPSVDAYHDPKFDASKLRMLGAKTTCKDRWRQVINEADRIPVKHLLTLQEGISPNQFSEMKTEGVILVVPSSLHLAYHKDVRPHLMSLGQFIQETRAQCG
jgi:hypothetical protein